MTKSKAKTLILLTLVIIFIFSNIFLTNKQSLEFKEKDQVQINQSGFWDLTGNPIYIDDLATGVGAHNWTWAETQPWCYGSGSWAYPYVIENVTIDGQGSGSCIEIKNSDAYFIIRNCSLYNSDSPPFNAGLKLDNVDNGKIINNNCSDNNFYGIYLSNSDNNTLSGNNASNSNYHGIYLENSNNNTLSGNNASNNNNYGIGLMISDNNTISGNTANNNYGGLYLSNSDNNTLSGNTASNNKYDGIFSMESNNNTFSGNIVNNNIGGIYLSYCVNNTISGNFMNFCGIYLEGSLIEVASHNIDKTNLVNNKQVYYYVNETGLGSSNFPDAGQIILVNCNNSIISELDGSGIYLYYCVNNTISENTVNNNTIGIDLYYSHNNTISGNNANSNSAGIYLWHSDNNTLSGNIASNNDYYGIVLLGSNNNTISGNNASNSDLFGIYLYYSDNNMFSGNTANNNNDFGIYLSSSDNNTLSGNTISNNSNGTRLDSNSNNNKIILNHFVNNGINAEDNGINNTWDDGFTGNYWNDYAGVDANDDGIGDTPYIVQGTAGSRDNFPMWTDGDDIAPVITIIFPLPDSVFGLDAPNYNISIDELNLDTIWYTLDGGISNYTITDLTGTFNQTAWEALSEGSLTIRFYANDTAGNISFTDVEVIIEIPEDIDDLPIISFGNYYILFTLITILSYIILEKRKKK